MFRKLLLNTSLFAVIFTIALATTAWSDIVIDGFTDPLYLYVHGTRGPVADFDDQTSGLADVFGGQRYAELTSFGARGVSVEIVADYMRMFVDSDAMGGADLSIRYNQPAPLNLPGHVAFQLELLYSDLAAIYLPVSVTVVSGTGTATSTQMFLESGVYTWQFGDFQGVDWSDVQSIGLDFTFSDGDGQGIDMTSVDLIIGPFTAVVPTPASMALLAIGLGMVVIRRRFV